MIIRSDTQNPNETLSQQIAATTIILLPKMLCQYYHTNMKNFLYKNLMVTGSLQKKHILTTILCYYLLIACNHYLGVFGFAYVNRLSAYCIVIHLISYFQFPSVQMETKQIMFIRLFELFSKILIK